MDNGNGSSPRDRRHTGRAKLDTTATVHLGSRTFVCTTRDVSAKGIALTHNEVAPTGSFLRLVLRLPGASRPLDLEGVLVRTAQEPGSATWGLEFHELLPHAAAALESYVADNRCDRPFSSSAPRLHYVRLQTSGTSAGPEGPVDQPDSKEQSPPTQDERLRALYRRAVGGAVPGAPKPRRFWHRWGRDSGS